MKVLIAYASAHGSTAEVAEFIGHVLSERGLSVTAASADTLSNIKGYDVIVLGTAIHAGTWLPAMTDFVSRFADELAQRSVFMWVNCIRVMEQYGEEHVMEHYMVHELLRKINPKSVTAFAGKLDLQSVDWNERWTLAARYDGMTWPSSFDGDFRNWDEIRTWAHQIADTLKTAQA